MLVLTRKLQERICIGDNIVVTVLRVNGSTVRLGIEAPQEVRVLRGELDQFEAEAPAPAPAAQPLQDAESQGPSHRPLAVSLADRVQQRMEAVVARPAC